MQTLDLDTDPSDYSDYSDDLSSSSENQSIINTIKPLPPSPSIANSCSNFHGNSCSSTTNQSFKKEYDNEQYADSDSESSSSWSSSSGSFSSASKDSDVELFNTNSSNIKIEPFHQTDHMNANIMDLYNKLFKVSSIKKEENVKNIKIKQEQVNMECSICSRSFFSHSLFKQHMKRRHNISQPYECDQCSKCYASKGSLRDHIKRHHLKIKDFECSICGKEFFDRYQWKEHMKIHERRESKKCNLCDAVFLYEAKWYNFLQFFIPSSELCFFHFFKGSATWGMRIKSINHTNAWSACRRM